MVRLDKWTYKKGQHYKYNDRECYYVYKNGKLERFNSSSNPHTFTTALEAKRHIGNQKRLSYSLYNSGKRTPIRMEQKVLSPTKLRYKKKKTSFEFDEWK